MTPRRWIPVCVAAVLGCALGARALPSLLRAAEEPPAAAQDVPEEQPAEAKEAEMEADAEGADEEAVEEPGPPLLLEIYDIGDLARRPADHPFLPGLVPPSMLAGDANYYPRYRRGGDGGGGLFSSDDTPDPELEGPSVAETISELKALITRFVDADSWADNGGTGEIRVSGATLFVQQTEENHRRLADFLERLRQHVEWVRMVEVKADWVLLAPAEVDRLLVRRKDGDESPRAPGVVDPALLRGLPKTALYAQGRITCAGGQTVTLQSGRARTTVQDLEAQVGTGVGMFDPEMEHVLAGVVLQVTPHVAGESALVDVASMAGGWNEPGEPIRLTQHALGRAAVTQPVAMEVGDGPAAIAGEIDRLNMTAQELRTTVRLPLGKPVLVGGMTLEPDTPAAVDAEGGDGRQLYLILEVTAD